MAVYLDHAATTPMPDLVREVYTDALWRVGNPSSIHQAGQDARAALETARAELAALIGVDPLEVVLTSGGTESINTWIKGRSFALLASGVERPVWLSTRAEHHATLDALTWLERAGFAQIRWLEVDQHAVVDLDDLRRALTEYPTGTIAGVTSLVANNEVASIQPIGDICRLAGEHSVSVHIDAIQAFGHTDIPLEQWPVDAMSVSAHKVGGPVGVGALVVRRGAGALESLHHGGGQQLHRSGTLDTAGAIGFATATRVTMDNRLDDEGRVRRLATRLRESLVASAPGVTASGHPEHRVDHIVHVRVAGAEGDVLLFLLDARGIRVSTGSACQAGVPEPSHVLLSMGVSTEEARGALRLSLGWGTTDADIDAVIDVFPEVVAAARQAGMADS